jgi:uncharacterized membrane protein YjjB (DUF3815 family)
MVLGTHLRKMVWAMLMAMMAHVMRAVLAICQMPLGLRELQAVHVVAEVGHRLRMLRTAVVVVILAPGRNGSPTDNDQP